MSEVNLKEDPTDDSIINVILHHPNKSEDNWVNNSHFFVLCNLTQPPRMICYCRNNEE